MLNFLSDPLNQVFVQRSLLEVLLLGLLCGVVSSYVVLRGVAFLVNALGHAVFPGIVVAYLVGGDLFWGGLAAGLIVVVSISLAERNQQVSESTAIGVLYIGAFGLGIVLVSGIKRASTGSLDNFLFGQLFGVGWNDVLNTLLVSLVVLGIIFLIRKELLLVSFDTQAARALGLPVGWLKLVFLILVALTVVTGLPAVGNILMIALLITPGATARLLTDRLVKMMFIAVGVVVVAGLVGILASYHLGLAPGSCVVVALTGLFLLALLYTSVRNAFSARPSDRSSGGPSDRSSGGPVETPAQTGP
jgi:manganese/iron transport system permease protein